MTKSITKIFYIYKIDDKGHIDCVGVNYIKTEIMGGFLSEEAAIQAIKDSSEIDKFYGDPEFVIIPSFKFYGY